MSNYACLEFSFLFTIQVKYEGRKLNDFVCPVLREVTIQIYFLLLGYKFNILIYALLTTCFTLVPCLAYYSTLKMEATYSSETL
jgi:hypothetical protein